MLSFGLEPPLPFRDVVLVGIAAFWSFSIASSESFWRTMCHLDSPCSLSRYNDGADFAHDFEYYFTIINQKKQPISLPLVAKPILIPTLSRQRKGMLLRHICFSTQAIIRMYMFKRIYFFYYFFRKSNSKTLGRKSKTTHLIVKVTVRKKNSLTVGPS